MRADRLRVEMAADVLGERAGRGIAPLGFLRGRLQHDVVEVAAQLATGPGRRRRQHAGTGVGIDLRGRRAGIAVPAPVTGHDFGEQHAERIDVGGGGDRPVVELFGRGVGGCHRTLQGLRGVTVGIRLEQLGDAEVEQLDVALARDQHVRGLEVAVHDQRAVRGLDRAADLHEQGEPLAQVERMQAHVLDDRFALDQLECDIGDACLGDAALDQLGDARVAQLGERVAFGAETAVFLRREQAAAQQFQRDGLAYARLLAHGTEHDGGAAFAERVDEGERPDARADRGTFRRVLADAFEQLLDRGVEQARFLAVTVGGEHAQDRRALRGIAAVALEPAGARSAAGWARAASNNSRSSGWVALMQGSSRSRSFQRERRTAPDWDTRCPV